MSEQPIVTFSKTSQAISARVLAECRRTYGSVADDSTIQAWVNSSAQQSADRANPSDAIRSRSGHARHPRTRQHLHFDGSRLICASPVWPPGV